MNFKETVSAFFLFLLAVPVFVCSNVEKSSQLSCMTFSNNEIAMEELMSQN